LLILPWRIRGELRRVIKALTLETPSFYMYPEPILAALMATTDDHVREAKRCRRLAMGVNDTRTFAKLSELADQHELCARIVAERQGLPLDATET
jgi:hypothetical protein